MMPLSLLHNYHCHQHHLHHDIWHARCTIIFLIIRFGRKKMMFLSMAIAAIATLASAYVHSYPIFLMLRCQKYPIFLFLRCQKYQIFLILRCQKYLLLHLFNIYSINQISGSFVVSEPWALLSPCAYLLLRLQVPGKKS